LLRRILYVGDNGILITDAGRQQMTSDVGERRQMSLVGFMQAGSTTVYSGSWRHPATEHGFLDQGYYQKLGRTLEEGCFDMMFFDDRLAMPGIYGGSVAEAVRLGARPVKLDLSIVLGLVAGVTRSIGLGATYSTTYYSPFHVARTFATLDHLSGGRAAWNVVTSVNDSEAQNYGTKIHLGHDERYDRADEFLEATTGLWDTWEDDALVLDRASGTFADPDKVHELGYHGEYFDVRGPLTVPRSPQGRPVLLQAGSSGRGREFAARWAELIFTGDPGIEVARSHYKDQKDRIAEGGRDPVTVKMLPMAYTVLGESQSHAEEREQVFLNDLVDPKASLTLLSELMNHDFSGLDLDAPITDELIESVSGIRGLVQNLRQHIGREVTLGDLAGHRATLLQGPRFVGTATSVADQMEEWFTSDACDGFVIAATHSPGAYEDVVRLVVPELQRRGLFRERYTGTTLRDTLGLPRPGASVRA
jgi:FMN-dependent oxidoreductase (nitrilotriacetate monooxygenase family)